MRTARTWQAAAAGLWSQDIAAESVAHLLAEEADRRDRRNPRSLLVTPSVPQFIDGVVEQRPYFELSIRDGVANVRHGGARGHRPVDLANVVLPGT